MSWVTDLWQILATIATLTKEGERTNAEMKEIRRDLNTLTQVVSDLKRDLLSQKENIRLNLDNYETEISHAKESIDAKFDVLTTRLDAKIADFEYRLPSNRTIPRKQLPRSKK